MKVFLMYRDQDFNLPKKPQRNWQAPLPELPWSQQALVQDLELNTLWEEMARGDEFLYTVARQAMLASLHEPDLIRYRQDIFRDCLKNAEIVRQLYQIPIISIENRKKRWVSIFGTNPTAILGSAVGVLEALVEMLRLLRRIADENAGRFESEGFRRFFAMIAQELDDDYFSELDDHLRTLRFSGGVLLSAELGRGNEGSNYVLRKPHGKHKNLVKRVLAERRPAYRFKLHPRDDTGARALSALRDRGINLVANAVAQSAEHIDSFMGMLRVELAFYVGCLNLHERLTDLGEPTAFPDPVKSSVRRCSFFGLYDACLALTMKQKIVGNDVNADAKDLAIITGANQGGKSTFLRSIGLAHLMMQCGMFVPAESFCGSICGGLFTHFKREEDSTMKSGKLDEELARMSAIVEEIAPDGMVLFNESFSATNEREGSEIAKQIVGALLKKGIRVFFVTHQYEFAHAMFSRNMDNAIFLRAERLADGTRTFRVIEGEPLETSYGRDLYAAVFGSGAQPLPVLVPSVGVDV